VPPHTLNQMQGLYRASCAHCGAWCVQQIRGQARPAARRTHAARSCWVCAGVRSGREVHACAPRWS